MMDHVIYTPKGAAREYSPLAANLYRGCAHGCKYCYVPGIFRQSREAFASGPRPRPGVLDQLAKDAKRLAARGEKGPVLLCFTSDPYQPCEEEHEVTQDAMEILVNQGLGVRLLTKNPRLAIERDLEVLVWDDVEFGVSLSWIDDKRRQEWEPYAGTVDDRIWSLAEAKSAGLRTWVSIEPVIAWHLGASQEGARQILDEAEVMLRTAAGIRFPDLCVNGGGR